MKIIKLGKPPEETIYRITCQVCKTEFEFQKREGVYHSDWRDGDYISIDCPVCKIQASTYA